MAGSTGNSLSDIMQKLRITPMPKWFCAFALAGLLCGAPLIAQDTLPDKNGELSGFRLDTPPPKVEPAKPEPKIEAPVERTAAKPVTPAVKPVQRPVPQKLPPAEPAQNTPPVDANVIDSQGSGAFTDIPPPTDTAKNQETVEVVNTKAPAMSGYMQYWPWVAASLALLFGIVIFWMWRRRRVPAVADATNYARATAPVPRPAPAGKPVVAPSRLSARFDPADARLSVTNLTIKGHLHLRYDGDVPLESLKLRTRVMSACEGQKALIDAFHSDSEAGQVESLGRVMPGEEIDLTLEMQVPRDALQAFDWRERRFVAPIVLINIATDDGKVTPWRISCVVGQEGVVSAARLQPIPIDRGPKLFAALQFHPIAA